MTELPADVLGKYGYMLEGDLALLRRLAARPVKGDLLNIGCFKGLSCSVLASVGPELKCIDPFVGGEDLPNYDSFAEWESNMVACGVRGRIGVYRDRSQDVMPKLKPHSFRVIFIDGSHLYENVVADFKNALKLIAPRGVIVFDDVNWGADFPIYRAANAVFGEGCWSIVPNTKCGVYYAD